jgi:anti-anti-sigma factor
VAELPSPGATVIVEVVGGRRESDIAQLRETIRGFLGQGCECILVDVAQITALDSVLLGAIMHGYISAMRVGTKVKLLHASRRVKELLTVTKLDRVLETVESEEGGR